MTIRTAIALSMIAGTASAEPLKVVTDIAPIQSLAISVGGELAQVTSLLPPGADPHSFALAPSDALALSEADVVIWIGHGLTPFLEDPIATLAPDAIVLELVDTTGWNALPPRMEEDDHDDHGDHTGHDDHADHDEHDHGSIDPHGWLSPEVMTQWTTLVAETLGKADPDNAATYGFNATLEQTAIAEATNAAEELLAPVRGGKYMVAHDGFQYFEVAFDVPAAGAVTLSDAARPGAAHLAELISTVDSENIDCILLDPQTNPEWVNLIADGSDVKVVPVDPFGTAFHPGPDLISGVILDLAAQLASCLSE